MTPFIFDDRCDWYDMPKEDRDHKGELGKEWAKGDESNMSAKRMSSRMSECIEECFEKWTPRKRFTLYKSKQIENVKQPGVII